MTEIVYNASLICVMCMYIFRNEIYSSSLVSKLQTNKKYKAITENSNNHMCNISNLYNGVFTLWWRENVLQLNVGHFISHTYEWLQLPIVYLIMICYKKSNNSSNNNIQRRQQQQPKRTVHTFYVTCLLLI